MMKMYKLHRRLCECDQNNENCDVIIHKFPRLVGGGAEAETYINCNITSSLALIPFIH